MDIKQAESPPPALMTRLFGWTMLATLFTYLLNNYQTVDRGFASASQLFSDGFSLGSLLQIGIYVAGFALAAYYVFGNRQRALRDDANTITRFNTCLIRACFWSVLFVGLADMAISFLRVEGILGNYFSPEMVKELGRPNFRGLYVHYPLIAAGFLLAPVTRTLGFQWLAMLIVAAELAIVITRFIFSYEQAFMGDLVRFWYAALFLLPALTPCCMRGMCGLMCCTPDCPGALRVV